MHLAKVELQSLLQGTTGTAQQAKNPKLERSAHEFEASLMAELLKPLQKGDGLTGGDGDGGEAGSEGALSGFASQSLARAIWSRADSVLLTEFSINWNQQIPVRKRNRGKVPFRRASSFPDHRRYSLRGGSIHGRTRSLHLHIKPREPQH